MLMHQPVQDRAERHPDRPAFRRPDSPLAIRVVAELSMTPTGRIAKSDLLVREASR